MARMTGRLLWVTLALCGAAFFFFLILSYNRFSPQLYELTYRAGWSIDNSLIGLIKYFPAIHASAILICYSLFYKPASGDLEYQDGPFYKLVMYSLVLFLISAMGGFLLREITLPGAEARQYRRMEETRIIREIERLAEKAENREDPAEAFELYSRLIRLKPEQRESLEIKIETLEQQIHIKAGGMGESGELLRMTERSPMELVEEARKYEMEEDFFSAYYYSSLAFQIDDQYTDARIFAAKMWSRIENSAPMREELERSYIFNKKKEGTDLLTAGRGTDAYYLFLALKNYIRVNGLNEDPDITKYLEAAGRLCLENSYFKEDTYEVTSTPGYRNLIFRNSDGVNGIDDTEIISLGRAVPHIPSLGIWMVEDIRVIRYNQEGTVYSLSAPYGKIVFGSADDSRGRLIMHGIVPEDKSSNYHVTYLEGSSILDLEDTLPLYIGTRELEALAEESLDYVMTNLMWLWESRGILENAGFSSDRIYLKILEKVLYPFSFLILCLFSVTFGWRFRQRKGSTVPATFIIFPFLPAMVFRLYELYTAANVSVLFFIRELTGFIPAFIALLLIQGIILIFSFVLLAGQRTS